MSDDLMLNLPNNKVIKTLDIIPEFEEYSELLQKTVVLCFLNKSLNLSTNGLYLCDLTQNITTGSATAIIQSLVPIADRVKMILNAEYDEEIVDSVSFTLEELSERSFKLYINIDRTDNTVEEGSVIING